MVKTVRSLSWMCTSCSHECVPIGAESRCLCGHRFKEHKVNADGETFGCCSSRCACKAFFFIVAEGSWTLRCRCKHKGIEHDAATHKCAKAKCDCAGFDSPWVCNCDHPWAEHKQMMVEKQVKTVAGMMAEAAMQVNNFAAIQRGEN